MSEHVPDELPALLAGELGRADTGGVAAHLRDCDACRLELVDTVAAAAALRSARRHLAPAVPAATVPAVAAPVAAVPATPAHVGAPVPAALPPLRLPPRRRALHPTVLASAAAVLVLLAVVLGRPLLPARQGPAPRTTVAPTTATLRPLAGVRASGTVTMRGPSAAPEMAVEITGLPSPGRGHFYEVWLLDPATAKMVAVGVLGPGGTSSYRLPGALVTAYSAVDVSLQPDNGSPAHSRRSVLRATYG